MTSNSHALPTGWIKEGMIVRCTTPVGLMQVRVVHSSGGISARRARMTKDNVVMLNADLFTPATIEDRILFTLDAANIAEIRKIIPDGKDNRQYRVIFMTDRPGTPVIDAMKQLFEKVESPERLGNALVVTVPQSWLDELVLVDPVTPAIAAQAAAETDLILEKAALAVAESAVVDWFVRSFTRLGVDMTGVQIAPTHRLGRTMGQDPTYALIWPSTLVFSLQIKNISAAAKELRLRDFFANGTKIIVDLPAEWMPTYGESPAAADPVGTRHVSSVETLPTEADEDLTETARLIDELRARNKQLVAENESLGTLADDRLTLIDSLTAEIDARDLRVQDAEESAEPVAQSLITCKEVKSFADITDAELEKHLNTGWDILHIQFGAHDQLDVVFIRNQPAPVAPTTTRAAAKLVRPVGPHVIIEPAISTPAPIPSAPLPTLNQAQTTAINFGTDISSIRATLAAMLNDTEVTHEAFYRAVITSRLPKQDKDAYIAQSRQMRVGAKIAAEAMTIPSPFINRPPIRIPAHLRAVEVNS